MKRSPFLILLLCLTPLEGQNNGIDQSSEIATAPTGETLFRWYGKVGRSYFIQVSDSANHLGKWNWAPLIESGNDEIISHDVSGTAGTAFYRLKHTDQPLDPGKTLETSDFDSDGLSNIDEIVPPVATIGGPTDPLNADTDGDGLSDSFERDHGLDPNDDGSIDPDNGPAGDPDGDGLTNAAEFALGTDPSNPDSDEDGLTDGEEVILTTDPNNSNTDGDMFEGHPLKDGEDADPNEILVNWKKAPEASYLLIDIEVPTEGDLAVDLNDKGEVLFGTGIWAGGTWIPKIAPEITGVYPGSVSDTYPDGIGYRVPSTDWDFFNNDRQLLQNSSIHPTEGPGVDSGLTCPVFWPSGQSTPSMIYETANLWDDLYWYNWPVGVSTAGDMVIRTRPLDPPSGTTEITERMDRFDSSGVLVGSMDGTDGFHPSGQGFRGEITASGWVVSVLSRTATATVTAAHKVGLWDSSNTPVALPVEADGLGHLVTVSDIPNEKVVMLSGQWTESGFNGKIFLPNAAGAYQHVPSLSSHRIQRFAGDGTAITGPHEITRDGQTIQMHQLWRNGKLIPLRDLCPRFGELEDAGWQLFPLKANKNGTYLIQASNADDTIQKTMLAVKVEIEQQNYKSSKGIRFCRWLDSFNDTGSMLADAAEVDRDRFRIRIPQLVPNLTKMKIKATGLHGAMIDGAFVEKATDGDYEVGMKPENGAMVSEWILLVSDGDDDKKFNGKGIDDKSNDQTLLADFDSKIIVTFPELDNAEAEFKAQKAVGKVTLNIFYMSPAGDVPAIMRERIDLHIRKMREIYRQIGIQVAVANIKGEIFEQKYFDEVPAPQQPGDPEAQPENYLSYGECGLLNTQIRSIVVPQNQIRIGYVDARLNPLNSSFSDARGWTNLGQDGITVSLRPGNHQVLGVTAHEVGHTLGLGHVIPKGMLMYGGEMDWQNDELDSKRFADGDYERIHGRRFYVSFQ